MERGDRHVDGIVPCRPDETDEQARTGEADKDKHPWHEKASPADFLAGRADEPDERKPDQQDH